MKPPIYFLQHICNIPFPKYDVIGILTTRGSQGVQAVVMTPLVIAPIGRFSTKKLVPYFQLPTQNPPSGFSNS